MEANFLINFCPAITCGISEDDHKIKISIWLSEIGTTYINDPAQALRKKYAGKYNSLSDIPAEIKEKAQEAVLSGKGRFDLQAAKFFGFLPSTCSSEAFGYYRMIGRRVEDYLHKTRYMDEILACALICGIPLKD